MMPGEKPTLCAVDMNFQNILDHSVDGVWINDGRGNVLYVNDACGQFFDEDPRFFLGKHLEELLDAGYMTSAPAIDAINHRVVVTKESLTRTGRRLLITARPILDSAGRVRHTISNSRDLTGIYEQTIGVSDPGAPGKPWPVKAAELRSKQILENALDLIVHSEQMRHIANLACRIASAECSVLILGESGVGKELIAKLIHETSTRREGPFVAVNCGAIPENLIEAELFGFEKNSFTDAKRRKPGLFECAGGGSLFLDEIGDLPLNMQVKLLRAIQTREIMRLGGVTPIRLDVRILAATNRDLEEMVGMGTFREDLFYRINVVQLRIPPLRERTDDILPLINHYLDKFNSKYHSSKCLSPGVLRILMAYSWPGNIRELENVMESLIVLCPQEIIGLHYLPDALLHNRRVPGAAEIVPLREAVEEVERRMISLALERYASSRKAAHILQVNHATVIRKIRKYRIRTDRHAMGPGEK